MTPPRDASRPAEWIDVTDYGTLPENEFRIVAVHGTEVGILRAADGSVAALRNLCPHRLAPICRGAVSGTMLPSASRDLEWGLEGLIVRCPWHQWEFNVKTGEPMFGVTRGRLRTYTTKVDDDRVYVRWEGR